MNTIFRKTKGLLCGLAAISIVILTVSPVLAKAKTARSQAGKLASNTSDTLVLDWIEIARTTIFPNGPPFEAARRMTIVQLAVFE
ncbi:MAG TPA: hypothetical protein VMS29_06765, partial [Pyrinomonadaceae bacterium]|nr:hypothetical protein [Pyrinomonadaceae bacterium]